MIGPSRVMASRAISRQSSLMLRRRRMYPQGFLQGVASRCSSQQSAPTEDTPASSSSSSSSSQQLAPIGGEEHLPAKLIDFQVASKIEGEESNIATVEIRPGEVLRAEAGAMLFMTHGVVMDTNLSGASSAFQRWMTGQNMFLTDFKYEGSSGVGTIGLGTDFPAKILRFSLSDFDNNTLICQRGAYLASNPTVNIEMEFTKNLKTGFFGGQGFVLQRLSGEGDVLVKGGGTIVCKELDEGQSIRVTSGSIVAFEPTIQYDVGMMPGK